MFICCHLIFKSSHSSLVRSLGFMNAAIRAAMELMTIDDDESQGDVPDIQDDNGDEGTPVSQVLEVTRAERMRCAMVAAAKLGRGQPSLPQTRTPRLPIAGPSGRSAAEKSLVARIMREAKGSKAASQAADAANQRLTSHAESFNTAWARRCGELLLPDCRQRSRPRRDH